MMIPVLMYHAIDGGDRYGLDPAAFERQLRYLHENGFRTIVPEELPLNAGLCGKAIMITFDDGHLTDYSVALPRLARFGFRGISFLTTGFIGREGYLSWGQAKELRAGGFSIQSHTHSHPLLNRIDRRSVREELLLSKQLLEDALGVPVSGISLPGGSFPKGLPAMAEEARYRYVFCSRPGLNESGAAIFNRMLITGGVCFDRFRNIVNMDRATYRRAVFAYHARNAARLLMGPGLYYGLWKRYYKER